MRLRKRRFFCGKVEKGKQMEERKPLIPVKELAKRYALFIISLFISALGVAITKKGELGVSPISSVASVIMLAPLTTRRSEEHTSELQSR